jgi:hypothetical protein
VIPTSEPDVKLDTHSVDYPFVTALLNQANRLKACIVAGKEMTLGLYLFKNYRPCSYGMWTDYYAVSGDCTIDHQKPIQLDLRASVCEDVGFKQ